MANPSQLIRVKAMRTCDSPNLEKTLSQKLSGVMDFSTTCMETETGTVTGT